MFHNTKISANKIPKCTPPLRPLNLELSNQIKLSALSLIAIHIILKYTFTYTLCTFPIAAPSLYIYIYG